MFQHKPKYHSFKNPHIKLGLLTRGQNPLSYRIYSIMNLNTISLPWYARPINSCNLCGLIIVNIINFIRETFFLYLQKPWLFSIEYYLLRMTSTSLLFQSGIYIGFPTANKLAKFNRKSSMKKTCSPLLVAIIQTKCSIMVDTQPCNLQYQCTKQCA